MTIRLSRLARQDLDDIRRYTIETWGRDRSLFAAGLRSVGYEKHVIFFARVAAADDAPVILRIVHQRRHMPALVYFEDLDA